ncbi:MAG: bifunctional hydroxymethylpyrimidine kinase/phosphomethylpyrimidine kinase [Chloroflexota bacterium]|nr:MAG: bifunctional hydroxymethylpyrimidine kinase/phosphomethylpyrimidine kinase [Chloroflexota bacterium]
MKFATAMTIAGSDSGGGAGIQADLKTFSALGVFGTSAITAITAQNTLTVTAIAAMGPSLVRAQIEAVLDDIGADAIKTGMLANSGIIDTVATVIAERAISTVVVDPVMVAKSGVRLLDPDAVATLRERLLPRALIVTPNLPEAEVLVGRELPSERDVRDAATAIVRLGARYVVVKGGHRDGATVTDLLHDGDRFWEFTAPRITTSSTHGTGCTFAAAIAARLALGDDVPAAVSTAKEYLHAAIAAARPIGHGHGPVHHFHRWY